MVERDLAKVDVAGSTPVSRSRFFTCQARTSAGFLFFGERILNVGLLLRITLI